MMNFYVYVYLNPLKKGSYKFDNFEFEYEPFYIGKGKNMRYLSHIKECNLKRDVNLYKKNIILQIFENKLTPIIIKIFENLKEEESFEKEKYMISLIKKKEDGGYLVNLTDGGEGG